MVDEPNPKIALVCTREYARVLRLVSRMRARRPLAPSPVAPRAYHAPHPRATHDTPFPHVHTAHRARATPYRTRATRIPKKSQPYLSHDRRAIQTPILHLDHDPFSPRRARHTLRRTYHHIPMRSRRSRARARINHARAGDRRRQRHRHHHRFKRFALGDQRVRASRAAAWFTTRRRG